MVSQPALAPPPRRVSEFRRRRSLVPGVCSPSATSSSSSINLRAGRQFPNQQRGDSCGAVAVDVDVTIGNIDEKTRPRHGRGTQNRAPVTITTWCARRRAVAIPGRLHRTPPPVLEDPCVHDCHRRADLRRARDNSPNAVFRDDSRCRGERRVLVELERSGHQRVVRRRALRWWKSERRPNGIDAMENHSTYARRRRLLARCAGCGVDRENRVSKSTDCNNGAQASNRPGAREMQTPPRHGSE